ncbi:hypothetical protein ES708_30801 [subsurface metagenome]
MRTKHGEIKGRPKNSSESDQFWSQNKTAEMQNQCAEIKIRAERKVGGMLKTSLRNKGETDKRIISHDGILSPKLNELGITLNQSHRWQYIASIPEEIFEKEIADTIKAKEDLMKLVVEE